MRASRHRIRQVLGLIALLGAVGVSRAGAQNPYSIQEVLSAPFPDGLVSAPEAGVVAWVYNDEGVRNLWVAVSPDFLPRQVTSYQSDDGQALSSLILTPDGNRIIFQRGGGPNAQGELPNPLSEVEGVETALWIVGVEGGEPRKLGTGSGPALSPDGSTLALTRDGAIWTLTLEEGAEPERVASLRGGPGSLTWSPDGGRLAFVSNRGDHSFVGVLHMDEKELDYLDPDLYMDRSPAWSPDGGSIAFIRSPYPRGFLPFTPVREFLPWSIRLVDLESGEGRTVWRANQGPGSAFRGVSARNQLFWGAGDHLVFPWEGDGWLGLYSIPITGGEATALTPGAFEVQYVSLASSGEFVLFSSNQHDIDRQHLWRAPVAGGAPEQLTTGEGIEWSPVSADESGAIAFLGSGPIEPARAEVLASTGERSKLLPDGAWDRFPSEELVTPSQVVFPGSDGLPIHGQLFLPRNHGEGEMHPALLFFHGGSRRQMLLGFHHRGYYHNAYAFNQLLASRGFVVLSVNYRSGIGYGLDFREALDYGAAGASEFNDVMGAGLYLRSRPDVDPDRIGLWGGSYGGYLTALGLARASDLFAAGVDLHGVHDWNVVIKNFVPSYEKEAHPEFAELAFRSSPMADLDGWRSPVLLIHGDDDRNVPFSESVDLAEELLARGVEFESLVFPDEVHGFLLHRNWLSAFTAALDFFERYLMVGR
jgi:dipeptidyl aminopeptidase/acylaminoacyl peptidase